MSSRGCRATEPGTTDENGVYTVRWEDIADDVEADTGFTATPDTAPSEGVTTGEPITEAGSTDANGVRTVTWDEIAPRRAREAPRRSAGRGTWPR